MDSSNMGSEASSTQETPTPTLRRTSRMGSLRRFFNSIKSENMDNQIVIDDEEPPPLLRRNTRMGSLRRFMNSSVRRTRKIFGIEAVQEVEQPPQNVRDYQIQQFNRNESYRLSRISTKNYQTMKVPSEDQIFTTMKSIIPPTGCKLVKYFPREGKLHDGKTLLTSFERKRRAHQVFGVDHHAKEQLFCPLQASQIEIAFRAQIKTDIIIKVQAPNGDCSGYINPETTTFTSFLPSNIGCGHGQWLIHVARRRGCKFHHGSTKVLNLVGQGVLFFEVDSTGDLREIERLWLDCLN